VYLSEQEHARLIALARRAKKTPTEFLREPVAEAAKPEGTRL